WFGGSASSPARLHSHLLDYSSTPGRSSRPHSAARRPVGDRPVPEFGWSHRRPGPLRRRARIIRYYEGRAAHHRVECPEGYGRIHPTIGWTVWVAWKWWVGGPIDALNDGMHRVPLLSSL